MVKKLLFTAVTLLATSLPVAAHGDDLGTDRGMMGMMWNYGFSGIITMIIFWALVIWFIVWLITQFRQQRSAMEILKERYAKGEITRKQFEDMKKGLLK